MKAITGYLAVTCVSVILAAVAMPSMTPTAGTAVKKSPIQASIAARKAQLAALEEL
jgi:hypothetical protein